MPAIALAPRSSFAFPTAGTGTRSGWFVDVELLGGTTGHSIAPRLQASAVPAVVETLGEFARGWFGTVEPSWPLRAEFLYELALVFEPATGTATAVRTESGAAAGEHPNTSPAAMLAAIRSILGLNVAETARVVGVERPTIYAWLTGRSTPQKANALRLVRIFDVASRWKRRSSSQLGDRARLPGLDGRSIVDLMSSDPIPEELIERRLSEAASHPAAASGAALTTLSIRDLARQHGIAASPRPGSQREIDWLTRRPLGAEDA